jgi:hypothetical protein
MSSIQIDRGLLSLLQTSGISSGNQSFASQPLTLPSAYDHTVSAFSAWAAVGISASTQSGVVSSGVSGGAVAMLVEAFGALTRGDVSTAGRLLRGCLSLTGSISQSVSGSVSQPVPPSAPAVVKKKAQVAAGLTVRDHGGGPDREQAKSRSVRGETKKSDAPSKAAGDKKEACHCDHTKDSKDKGGADKGGGNKGGARDGKDAKGDRSHGGGGRRV